MPSKPLRVLIVLCWLAVVGWSFGRNWLAVGGAGALDYRSLLAGRVADDATSWQILVNGRRIGGVLTIVQPKTDGSCALSSKAEFDPSDLQLPIPGKLHLNGIADVGPLGKLRTFTVTLTLESGGANIHGTLSGIVQGDDLVVSLHSPELPTPKDAVRIRIDPRMQLANSLAPTDRLPGLWVGRSWTTATLDLLAALPMANMFGGRNQTKEVRHVVTGTETIEWNSVSWDCFVVEDSQDELTGRTWVRRADGVVLRQEAAFRGTRVVMELDPAAYKLR